jgi:hypothetical protein
VLVDVGHEGHVAQEEVHAARRRLAHLLQLHHQLGIFLVQAPLEVGGAGDELVQVGDAVLRRPAPRP